MVGELAVSFCDRKADQVCVYLDVWSYPDGSFNLVLENLEGSSPREIAFPCALHQLAGVLKGKPFVNEGPLGSITVDRCRGSVCAEFKPAGEKEAFKHCIPMEEFCSAIDALESRSLGYLA